MPANEVRKLRLRLGRSQTELAEAVKISLPRPQRIEAGVESVRLEVAHKISSALGQPMDQVFPAAKNLLAEAAEAGVPPRDLREDEEDAVRDFDEVGIDVSAEMWTFRYRLRGRAVGDLRISGRDKDRLWFSVQTEGEAFIVFDSQNRRYAINPKHLLFCQFLFDPPYLVDTEEVEPKFTVEFQMADGGDPICLSVDPDSAELSADPEEGAQLQGLFVSAETSIDSPIFITDEDGETAFLRAEDVAMFSASLTAVEPGLLAVDEDDWDEDDDAAAGAASQPGGGENVTPFPRL